MVGIRASPTHHVWLSLPHDEVGTPITARAQLTPKEVLTPTRRASARLVVPLALLPPVERASGDQAADEEDEPGEICDQDDILGNFDGQHTALGVVAYRDVAFFRRGVRQRSRQGWQRRLRECPERLRR